MEPCLKLPDNENIIKATRWLRKSKSRQTVDGLCEPSRPHFKSGTYFCFSYNQGLCYNLVKVPFSFPNKLQLLPSPHPPLLIILHRFCASNCLLTLSVLFLSFHLTIPFCRMPVTSALPEYETNCYHPSSFKNHCLNFHILLLLRRLRYILPTFIY